MRPKELFDCSNTADRTNIAVNSFKVGDFIFKTCY